MGPVGGGVDALGRCFGVAPLAGHTIGITGHRRSDELAAQLQSLGATVIVGPAVQVRPVTDELEPLRRSTEALIAEPPDFVITTTGIGIRSWVGTAAAWGLRPALLDALRCARILARGPKVVGALSELGLEAWFTGPEGRADELLGRLREVGLAGAHVAVVLPGGSMPELLARLDEAGAGRVTALHVYDWQWPDDLEPPKRLARAVADGRVDAITFTSRPAVRNFLALATQDGVHEEVVRSLRQRTVPICVGTATADELAVLTGATPVAPPLPVLGMVVQQTATELAARHHHVRTARGDELVVQGRLILGGETSVTASDREAALLHRLLAAPRSTVSRTELLRDVWGDTTEASVLETTIARLRRRLSRTGLTILTITSRGYLLGGELRPCPQRPQEPHRPLIDAT